MLFNVVHAGLNMFEGLFWFHHYQNQKLHIDNLEGLFDWDQVRNALLSNRGALTKAEKRKLARWKKRFDLKGDTIIVRGTNAIVLEQHSQIKRTILTEHSKLHEGRETIERAFKNRYYFNRLRPTIAATVSGI